MNRLLRRKKAGVLRGVRLIVYDFDGVLTDGRVVLREDGMESVTVHRSDGMAIAMIRKAGIPQVILSGERNPVVAARAGKLGIPSLRGVDDKKARLLAYCGKLGVPLGDVVYAGNELNDLEAMRCVGHPVCPSDACAEVRRVAEVVLAAPGGGGVARELLGRLRLRASSRGRRSA